jgi:signal transduction histidine kinase
VLDAVSVWLFFFVLPFAAGRSVTSRTALNTALQANLERLEDERRERARQAIIAERTRIARELHDVVAHSVSVMVIQTSAARRVAARDPLAAAEALRSVENCGRDALIDMRRMMGVIHRADTDVLGAAAPGLSQLTKLVERAQSSGLSVQVAIHGKSRPLSAALDLMLFRVVQEALTNVIKHAGAASARIELTYKPNYFELDIVDGGGMSRREPRPANTAGHGLIGMQERIALYGGQLTTGRGRGGGFHVQARIPLTDTAPA